MVCLEENGTALPTLLTEQEVKAPELTGLDRSQKIVIGVLELVHELKPDRIVVEGYSLNMKNARAWCRWSRSAACCGSCSSSTGSPGTTRGRRN